MVSAAAASALSLLSRSPPGRSGAPAALSLSNPYVADGGGGDREEAAGGQCR